MLTSNSSIARKIYQTFKILKFVFQIVNAFFNAKYLLKLNTKYFNLTYYILGQELIRKEEELSGENQMITFLRKYGIFVLYLLIKGLEWHFDPNNKKSKAFADGSIDHINPPFKNDNYQGSISGICMLCHKKIVVPCCLETCGKVFCQICIFEYVQKVKKCPVTHINCDVDKIHRLFEQ
jgi:hypothetical protein